MINRRALFQWAAVAGTTGAVAACSNQSQSTTSSSQKSLTVGLSYIPNVQFCAFYLGLERGIFAKHGLAVTLRHHGEQEDVFGALLGGQEDVVFASADEALVAAAGGQDLRSFATSYQTYPVEVLALNAGQTKLSALAGRTLGIPGHYGSSYYAALAAIHEAGLTTSDVALQDIGYTQVSALQSGKVDFIMGFSNNEAVQLELQGATPSKIAIFSQPKLVGPSLVCKGEILSDSTLAALSLAMKESEEAVIADQSAALDATVKQVPALADATQRKAAEAVLKATIELWKIDGAVSVALNTAAFDAMADFLVTAGVITTKPEKFYRVVS